MIAAEHGHAVDVEAFDQALGQQRRRSRAARKVVGEGRQRGGEWVEVKKKKQKWVGYAATKAETEPIAFRQTGDQLEIILEENPFYAESGGQVSDTGVIKGDGWELTVEDVEKVDGKSAVVGTFGEAFEPTAAVAQVNEARRRNIERNHTATHLVHAALRKVLGTHVRQAGSVVAPDRLRFDFSHHGPIEDAALSHIEEEVNEHIWENHPVETREMAYKDAIAAGAMAFFTEKYGDIVRVVDVPGVSLELCGGTHVPTTGQIALFRFTHETGAAAGVRRIEALTGPAAYRHALDLQKRLSEAAGLLKTQPEHLARRIEAMLEENRKLERRMGELLRGGAGAGGQGAVEKIGDVELHVSESNVEDRGQIAAIMDGFRAQHKRAISVLFTTGARAGIHVAVTDDLVSKGIKAGDIANAIAKATGGKGGGRPHFASAGVGDPAKLGEARARTPEIVRTFATPQ
jgi:alanyl-tRNA synthetase